MRQAIKGSISFSAVQEIDGTQDILRTASLVPIVKENIVNRIRKDLRDMARDITVDDIRFETLNIPELPERGV